MIRLNVIFLMALVASALYLVSVQYEWRRLYSELHRAETRAHQLEADNERLTLEKRTLAASARVENLAKTKLEMRAATPAVTAYVSYKPQPAEHLSAATDAGTPTGRAP